MSYGKQPQPITALPLFAYVPDPVSEPEFAPAYQPATPTKVEHDGDVLLAYLKVHAVGKENRIAGKELVRVLGFKNEQHLRAVSGALRMEGNMVLATIQGGYFMGTTIEEFREFLDQNYLNRVETTVNTINAMINSARVHLGAPADAIKGVKIVRIEHEQLPERLHV